MKIPRRSSPAAYSNKFSELLVLGIYNCSHDIVSIHETFFEKIFSMFLDCIIYFRGQLFMRTAIGALGHETIGAVASFPTACDEGVNYAVCHDVKYELLVIRYPNVFPAKDAMPHPEDILDGHTIVKIAIRNTEFRHLSEWNDVFWRGISANTRRDSANEIG